ncbi:propanediol/glycerol family dehydratase large subunit, partial [Klebsiella pneumoniae]
KSAQIREILISESAWEEMTCLFAPSFAQEIINKNRNGLEVVKALAKGGFPDVAQDMLNIQKAKLTGDYLHTSAIIVGEGQVLSAVNDVNDYAGPATGYRLQGERWEEIKNIPGALDPNELG